MKNYMVYLVTNFTLTYISSRLPKNGDLYLPLRKYSSQSRVMLRRVWNSDEVVILVTTNMPRSICSTFELFVSAHRRAELLDYTFNLSSGTWWRASFRTLSSSERCKFLPGPAWYLWVLDIMEFMLPRVYYHKPKKRPAIWHSRLTMQAEDILFKTKRNFPACVAHLNSGLQRARTIWRTGGIGEVRATRDDEWNELVVYWRDKWR